MHSSQQVYSSLCYLMLACFAFLGTPPLSAQTIPSPHSSFIDVKAVLLLSLQEAYPDLYEPGTPEAISLENISAPQGVPFSPEDVPTFIGDDDLEFIYKWCAEFDDFKFCKKFRVTVRRVPCPPDNMGGQCFIIIIREQIDIFTTRPLGTWSQETYSSGNYRCVKITSPDGQIIETCINETTTCTQIDEEEVECVAHNCTTCGECAFENNSLDNSQVLIRSKELSSWTDCTADGLPEIRTEVGPAILLPFRSYLSSLDTLHWDGEEEESEIHLDAHLYCDTTSWSFRYLDSSFLFHSNPKPFEPQSILPEKTTPVCALGPDYRCYYDFENQESSCQHYSLEVVCDADLNSEPGFETEFFRETILQLWLLNGSTGDYVNTGCETSEPPPHML